MLRKLVLFILVLLVATATVWAGSDICKARGPLAINKAHHSANEFNSIVNPSTIPPLGPRNGNSLDEVVISEDFEAIADGSLPVGWTQVDVDQGNCTDPNATGLSVWQVWDRTPGFTAHSGTHIAANHYNDGALANNDWLILPVQNLTGAITLSYWVASQQATYPESFEVKVSTTGTLPANFTNLIQRFNNISATFTQHTHDLSAYAGAPFYIAFHYISVDMWVIKLDDVVLETISGPVGAVGGTVTDATSHDPLSSVKVVLNDGTANVDSTTTNAQGRYLITTVTPGTYNLVFSTDDYADVTRTGEVVVAGDTTTVDVEMVITPGLSIYRTTAASVRIPDYCATCDSGRMTLNVPDDILIDDIEVKINVTHTYPGDLVLWLKTPWNTRIKLADRPGNGGPYGVGIVDCRLDDEATIYVDSVEVPYTGRFKPTQPLSTFDGTSAQGTWTLIVYDASVIDSGTIDNFTLYVSGADAVGDQGDVLPATFVFQGNYPNPFNATTEFNFELARQSLVELKLYNTIGQEVAVVANNTFEAGAHTVSFNGSGLTSGLYFARMTAAGTTQTQKVMLLK